MQYKETWSYFLCKGKKKLQIAGFAAFRRQPRMPDEFGGELKALIPAK
jgi:hypothetical protein